MNGASLDNILSPEPVTHAQFMVAASRNDVATLRRYLEQGGNVDLLDAAGECALLVATRAGHEEFLVELLDASPKFEAQWEGSALEAASLAGRPDLVAMLYRAFAARSHYMPAAALVEAIAKDDMRTVRRFLAMGDSPASFAGALEVALLKACELGRPCLAALLLSAGANPRVHDSDGGNNPLSVAAKLGDGRTIGLLLEHAGTDASLLLEPPAPDHALIPLFEAARHHRAQAVRQLLKAGARSCVSGHWAIEHALMGYGRSVDAPAAAGTLDALLESMEQSDIEALHARLHRTLVHEAVRLNAWQSIDALVARGIPADAPIAKPFSDAGATPFLQACQNRSIGCLRALAAHGADITRRSRYGQSALTLAITADDDDIYGRLDDVVACLLELGCDPDAPDLDGKTPRTHATAARAPALLHLMDAQVARRAMQDTLAAAGARPRSPSG